LSVIIFKWKTTRIYDLMLNATRCAREPRELFLLTWEAQKTSAAFPDAIDHSVAENNKEEN